MAKIKSLDDLKKMQSDLQSKINIREQGENPESHVQIKVAMATCGIASGAKEIMDFLINATGKRNLDVVVTQTGCMGYCHSEPTIEVNRPGEDPVIYGDVDVKKADEILEKHVKRGELVDGIIPVTHKTIDETK
ncbi:MAG: (2Fe-2S) ferredoxin domain-containing protein [Bacteroidales bacterium]|nr:(2Fe-2S) ferredoxin domain-containing protein [Bacteroidales bacterium]